MNVLIGDMRARVVLKRWTSVKGLNGGTTAVNTDSWTLWAKIEDRSGFVMTDKKQMQWAYDYKVTVRHNANVQDGDTIDYGLQRMRINSIQRVSEGKQSWDVLRCSTVGKINLSALTNMVYTLNYTGIGGESTVTSATLIDKRIVGAFKDGIEYKVITVGTPTNKEVKFDDATGILIWSTPFATDENSFIQYQDV